MKIRAIRIENFRSLSKIELIGLPDLLVLIGRNGSGKSNFLEAIDLFFNEIDPEPQRTIPQVDDFLWFDRDTSVPIKLTLSFELNQNEFNFIFSPDILSTSTATTIDEWSLFAKPTISPFLHLTRELGAISNQSMQWATTHIALGRITEKVSTVIPIADRTSPEEPLTSEAVTDFSAVLTRIAESIKGNFELVPAIRSDRPVSHQAGKRQPFISNETRTRLDRLRSSTSRDDMNRWARIIDHLENVLPFGGTLIYERGRYEVKEGDIYFPLEAEGSGFQEFLTLAERITGDAYIYAVEEPEVHFHPSLSRYFLKFVEGQLEDTQIILSTHSTTFLDDLSLENAFSATKQGKETKITRLRETEDLLALLYEIGEKPSSIFFAQKILWVEGPVDRLVIPILAKNIGVDFRRMGVNVIPLRGSGKGEYHLRMVSQIAKDYGQSIFMILDRHATAERSQLITSGLIARDRIRLLRKHDIIDYLPKRLVAKAVTEKFPLHLKAKDIKTPIKDSVRNYLKRANAEKPGWDIIVAEYGARHMTDHDLKPDLKEAILEAARLLT